MLYRPIRARDIGFLKERAKKMIENTGQDEITLSSLSSSDYKELPDLPFRGKPKHKIELDLVPAGAERVRCAAQDILLAESLVDR